MQKKTVLISIFLIIFLGFILGFILKPLLGCTEMYCSPKLSSEMCELSNRTDCISKNSTEIIEIPCNSCGMVDPFFVTGILNVYKTCSGKEILVYRGPYEHIETTYDLSDCNFRIGSFEMFFGYLIATPLLLV
jgi:hypothetical protein